MFTSLPASCLVAFGFAMSLAAGCSDGRTNPRPRLDSLAAEPELPVSTAPIAKRPASFVPNVTRPPKPFRVADLAAARSMSPPAGLPGTGDALPTMIATGTGGTVQLTSAQEPRHLEAPADSPLVAEIRDMLSGYLRSFNRHDALAVASHWAPSAENVNLDSGEVTAGREAVQSVFAALFDVDSTATIDIDVASIRSIRDDVALIDGVSRVGYEDGEVIGSRFSAVAVRHEGKWLLESVREAGATKVASAPRPLDELAWLVGSWENVGPGVIAGGRCDWWSGRSYLVRTLSITPDSASAERPRSGDESIPSLLPTGAASARELTEIIGWDPERQEIRSWIFSSDGRFAEATWQRDGETWTVHAEGRGLDTGRSATCTIVRGGADAIDIRCKGTGLESLVPPACGFTRTSR